MNSSAWLAAACLLSMALGGGVYAAPVSVPDPNLEQALELAMTLPVAIDGLVDDAPLAALTELTARNRGIADLTGIEAATSLLRLDLRRNSIVSLEPLRSLASLQFLDLAYNDVEDVEPLSGLTGLRSLDLGFGNPFEDLDQGFNPFAPTNSVTDISPLVTLVDLEYLNLAGNAGLSSIAAISSLSSLVQIWIGGAVSDFSPLAGRAAAIELIAVVNTGALSNADVPILNAMSNADVIAILAEPGLTDIGGLTNINPDFFVLGGTGVTSLQPLSNFTNMHSLFIPFGVFESLDGLETLANLRNLVAEDGNVSDISALAGLTALSSLALGNNQIADISALETMVGLNHMELHNNLITDLQPLIDNPGLGESDRIDLTGNPLPQTSVCEQLPILRAKFVSPLNVKFDQVCGEGATLTVNVIGTGHVSPGPGTVTVELGTTLTVSVTPIANSGYAYKITTGSVSTIETSFDIVMDSYKQITVEFVNTGPIRTLEIAQSGAGAGSTSPQLGFISYLDGRSAIVTAEPAANGYFAGWSGDLNSMYFNEVLQMNEDRSIVATFAASGFDVEVKVEGAGETLPPAGIYPYAAGSVVPLLAIPSSQAKFVQWTGPVENSDASATTVTVDAPKTVTARFAFGDYSLTIGSTGGGSTIPPPGISYYFDGAIAVVQAVSTPATAFAQWTGDLGGQNPTSPSISLIMNQNRTIAAEFGTPDFFLTVGVSGNGSTSPPPGIYGFKAGRTAFVSAVQTTAQVFQQWSGNLGGADPLGAGISLLMNENRTVTAEFMEADFSLTINVPVGSGSTVPPAGNYGFASGAEAVVLVRVDAGFRFTGWQGDFTGTAPTAVIPMNADKTVTPVFEAFANAPILFADPNFEQVVRAALNMPSGAVFPLDAVALPQLQAGNSNVSNLQGLEFFNQISRFNGYSNPLGNIAQVSGLTMLMASDIASCQVTDISPYNYLPFLEDLNFGANLVSDLSGLTVLPSLRRLVAFENDIADISTLANFRTLRELNLNDNEVTDLSPLAGLINLERLRMLNNDVQSVAPLANLLNLRTIALAGSTSLSDISGLAGLTQLQELDLSRCAVSDISALQSMPNLNFVSLINNQVTDLTPLLNNPGFGMDDQLFISGNPLSQVAACEQALELEARGVLVIGAVCDQEAPIITRNGQAVVAVALQSIYTDAGAIAIDSEEGNLTSAIVVTNPVNTFAAGTYIVRYNVMDSLGNAATEVTRTVHVVPSEILLSFQLQLLISGFNGVDTNQDGKLGLAELQARIPGITQNDLGARDLDLSGGLELTELILATYPGPVHTGDRDADGRFILSEVLRLVQFYNSGGHHCAPGTEDAYAPGPGSTACLRHAADVLPNFIINLTELLRVIQLFNSGGYAACPAQQTEDGYCPGAS